jgi:hypothetical protein
MLQRSRPSSISPVLCGALQADVYIIHRHDLAQLSPYQTRRQRFGDYTLSLSPPEPFDAELLMPSQLDEQPETVVVA